MPYLFLMRGYLYEMLALPEPDLIGRRDEEQEKVLMESFEVVESVIERAFGENQDIMAAVAQMSEMMEERMEYRRGKTRRCRYIYCAIVAMIFVVGLAFLLSLF